VTFRPRASSWRTWVRILRSRLVLRSCQLEPRSVNLASGLARRCQAITRMERATAHFALFGPRRRDRRRIRSPRKVSVRAAPVAAWVQ
jgi:hypothetical protein